MSKLIFAIAVGSIALGINCANAKQDASTSKQWKHFQAAVTKCDARTGADQTKCMESARKTYRSAHFDCDTMPPRDKADCQKYHDRWISAANSSNTPAVHSGEPNTMPANPGDPTDKERNRDSTKQDNSPQATKKP